MNAPGPESPAKKVASFAGKIPLSLFFGVFLAMGLAFAWFILQETWQTAQTYSWTAQICTITLSEVKNDPERNRDKPYIFLVQYRYEVGGRTYTSNQYQSKIEKSSDWKEMEDLSKQYPSGSKSTCYVNPVSPSEAVLRQKSLFAGFMILLPLIFVVVGGGGIWFIWFPHKPKSKSKPLSQQAGGLNVNWVLPVLFFIFLAAGLGVAYSLSGGVLDMIHAGSWVEVPCTVESSRVSTHNNKDGSTYRVDILYHYTFNNQTFRSNRYSFIRGSSSGYKSKAAVVAQYPPGSVRVCYVNPADPSRAVLFRGWSWETLLLLIPVVFIAIGTGGLIYVFKPKRPETVSLHTVQGTVPLSNSMDTINHTPNTPVVLRPKTSAFVKMCGMAAVALFWNGIISIFLFQAADSWKQGNPDWFLTIFMIPFVAIGLGMIGGVFYLMLCIGNPRAKLALNSSAVALGETLRLGWGFDGKTDRIQNLTLTVEAREEATYRRGTRTYTDKNTFFRQEAVNLSDPRQIIQGLVEIEIPKDLVPTLSSKNNKIVWTISLHGVIPLWPDVKEEFEFTVLPVGRFV